MGRAALSPKPTLAERYRAHRQAFELALELGCTPAEAAAELDRRAARARWEQAERRLRARIDSPLRIPSRARPPEDAPWMMRD